MYNDHRNSFGVIKKCCDTQECDMGSKTPKYFPTSDQFIVANGHDKHLHLLNGNEKIASNGLGTKDSHVSGEIMETSSIFIALPKDIATSVIYFGNGIAADQGQTDVEKFIVYKTRFWILGLFSYISFIMILVWATFSPIISSAEYAYDWNDGYIALLEGLGSIFSVSFMIPFNWMTQKYGLRVGMLTVCTLISLATGLRCVTSSQTAFTYLAAFGAVLNGSASCLLLSLPAMLSVQWFPMNERATATAVCAIATQLGIAGMYFSPLIVRTPVDDVPPKDDIQSDIHVLMLIYFGMAFSALVGAVFYFPAKPPTSPSASSSLERVDYFKSIKLLIRNRDVMIVSLIYTFSLSIPFCWMSIMNFSLSCLGISQDESMWIAIAASVISSISTFIVARLTDRFHGYMKLSIAALLFGASCSFLWVLLMTEGVIVASKVQIFIAIILAISLQYSTVPLMIEFAAELAYPCPEIAVGALLSFLLDAADAIFLLLLMINSNCYHWLSYALVSSTFFTIIPLLLVNEEYKRSELDTNHNKNSVAVNNGPNTSEMKQTCDTNEIPLDKLSMPD